VIDLAKGKCFIRASGHDSWSENLVSACVHELERHQTEALAMGTSYWIDGEGPPLNREVGYGDTRGMGPVARFFTVFWGDMHPIPGLFRLDYAREIGGIRNCAGSDFIMSAALAPKGDFIHVGTTSWCRREFRGPVTHNQRLNRYRSAEYGLARSLLDRGFPLMRLPIELLRVVWHSRLPLVSQLTTVLAMVASFPVRYVTGRR